jgi:HSP20 family protein
MTKWLRALNINEISTAFVVELATPGFSSEDFHIEISGEDLTIEARKDEAKIEYVGRFMRTEFVTASFARKLRLPQHLRTDEVDAKYENGILKLVLPKREETMQFGPKQVKIS